jgi:hypothetical protein
MTRARQQCLWFFDSFLAWRIQHSTDTRGLVEVRLHCYAESHRGTKEGGLQAATSAAEHIAPFLWRGQASEKGTWVDISWSSMENIFNPHQISLDSQMVQNLLEAADHIAPMQGRVNIHAKHFSGLGVGNLST